MKKIINIPVKSNHHNKPIVTDVFYSENKTKKPIVVFCHGYKGYKDWGAWNLMSKSFVKNELFFVKFNFSHNGGTLENPIDFPDLEAFGANNYTIELNDIDDVIEWLKNNPDFKDEIDVDDITLIGHSRGGGIVTIKASENDEIKRVISWNGVSDFESRYPQGEDLDMWKSEGVSYVLNSRTNQKMPHFYQFYENFKANEERLTIHKSVKKLMKPQLIIQGTADVVVKPFEAQNLHSWNPNSELILIQEMNHTLGAKHPWDENELPKHLEKAIAITIDFIK
ncbi:alpha/beta hydrolase family protein [Urechidicola croceus]|uniref:Alpha/beta hydrolase n=1 Tax=Urechidicola croceus TaxID=1850246 RepID=A0A1D8P9I1_9FLAO|nr:alpha/beta fold hydrolase [Urechidicola croceus]AOW21205.1 alpha/beta hydrolase [Urechidicola croceus]